MLLLVGLGNPNPNRANNRHNVGFTVIDSINLFSDLNCKPSLHNLSADLFEFILHDKAINPNNNINIFFTAHSILC